MSKEAYALMKKAMSMMEKSYGGGDEEAGEMEGTGMSEPVQQLETRMSPMPNEDGSSSSLGNSGYGGEIDDIESRKQKKEVIMAAMKKKGYGN